MPEVDSIHETKASLRAMVRDRLVGMTGRARARLSAAVCEEAVLWGPLTRADCVLAYAPMPMEVDIEPLIEALLGCGVTVCVPRVDWEASTIVPVPIRDLIDDLSVIERGVRQPRDTLDAIDMARVDVVIAPAVGFDLAGGRLGRGGGFYDRVLGSRTRPGLVLGVGFEAQVVESIPMAGHDKRVDALATPARLVEFTASGSDQGGVSR
jgi:5-formyltetrahydrofolate cyclo-ligase